MLTRHKGKFQAVAEACARVLMRLGFTPNGLTLLSLGMGLLTAIWFMWSHDAVLFAPIMLLWGVLDSLDGAAARLSGRPTRFGSYLDALCDRIFEGAAVLAGAWVTGHWLPSMLLIMAANAISYAKARAAMEVPISNNEWSDLMERTERGVLFLLGIFIWGIFPETTILGRDLFFWALVLLNVALYATLLQRILRARRIILEREDDAPAPSPEVGEPLRKKRPRWWQVRYDGDGRGAGLRRRRRRAPRREEV